MLTDFVGRVRARDRVDRSLAPKVRLSDPWVRGLSIVCFFAMWEIVALILQSRVLPPPHLVAEALWRHIARGELIPAVGVTLFRVAQAFFISMILGTALGMALGRNKALDRFFDGWLVLGLNIPALVVGILCYVWFGLAEHSLIIAVVINKVPTVAVTVREGARAVDHELLQVARAFRVPAYRTLTSVYLPQLYPYIMAAARSGLALIWKIILVYELLGRSSGVGFQLQTYFGLFDIKSILAYSFAFMAVVLCIEMIAMRGIERRLTRWRL